MDFGNQYVVIICPACGDIGSVANVAIHHARELAKYFRVTIISNSIPKYALTAANQVIKPRTFGFLRRFAHVPNEIAFAIAARAALVRLHRELPVNFVICHGHTVAALSAWPLRRKLGISYGLVTHGDINDRPKGTYDPRLTWLYQKTTPPAYRDADLIIALSPYMAVLAVLGGANPNAIKVIPNGIESFEIGLDDKVAYSPKESKSRLEILYIGRLSVDRGVDVLLHAVALIKSRGVAFRLRIVGGGLEESTLRALASKLRLDETVEFIGPALRRELGDWYRSADVVCVPSRSDPLPTVVLEAMRSGVAVAGTDTGGISYMIDNGVTGLVCPPNDPIAFADVLERFAGEMELVVKMGEAGRQRAIEVFNWQKVGNLLIEAIIELRSESNRKF